MNKSNDYCVIMAGGVGSRFWPLSRTGTPKQFIDILGTGQSLIQMTFERFRQIIPVENIYIVTNQIYKEQVLQHLPDFKKDNILLEPLRKNTAPCIAFATHRIASINPDANIIVAPSDHLIVKEVEFLRIVEKGLRMIEKESVLLTIGIKPSRPETGYGYIQAKKNTPEKYSKEGFLNVKTFTEKPNFEMARLFFESGDFYWNSGIFFWSAATILREFEVHLNEIFQLFNEGKHLFNTQKEKEFIERIYAHCTNISIDYGILEKTKDVFVIPSDIGWSDLGTWGSMYEHSQKDNHENAINPKEGMFLYDVKNSIINIPKDKIAIIQGLKDYIVVDTEKALLICKKEDEQSIRDYVNEVKLRKGDAYI